MNTVDKYYWCIDHEGVGVKYAQGAIELTPHMVNPENDEIDLEDSSKNTKMQWWIEYSKLDEVTDDVNTHYWSLDCGGDSVDEAVDKLYDLMFEQYGDY